MQALIILARTALGLVESVFIKKYNSKHSRGGFLFTAFISLFSMLVFLFTDKGGFSFPPDIWIYGIISGIIYSSASILTYIALGCGSFAMSMLILSYGMVFATGYGLFFLGEEASIFTYIGLVLILISLFLTRRKMEEGDEKKISWKWIICIGLSFVGSGMYGVISRMQQIHFENAVTNEYMIITLAFSFIALFVTGLIIEGRDLLYMLKNGNVLPALAGISNGVNNSLGLYLNTIMAISISAPVSSGVKTIASFLISLLIFKEKFEKRQIVGVIIGGAALVLLNL